VKHVFANSFPLSDTGARVDRFEGSVRTSFAHYKQFAAVDSRKINPFLPFNFHIACSKIKLTENTDQ
jgi:hypothetical protein